MFRSVRGSTWRRVLLYVSETIVPTRDWFFKYKYNERNNSFENLVGKAITGGEVHRHRSLEVAGSATLLLHSTGHNKFEASYKVRLEQEEVR